MDLWVAWITTEERKNFRCERVEENHARDYVSDGGIKDILFK